MFPVFFSSSYRCRLRSLFRSQRHHLASVSGAALHRGPLLTTKINIIIEKKEKGHEEKIQKTKKGGTRKNNALKNSKFRNIRVYPYTVYLDTTPKVCLINRKRADTQVSALKFVIQECQTTKYTNFRFYKLCRK